MLPIGSREDDVHHPVTRVAVFSCVAAAPVFYLLSVVMSHTEAVDMTYNQINDLNSDDCASYLHFIEL